MLVTHIFKATGLSGAEAHLLALASGLCAEGIESRLAILVDRRSYPTALVEGARARGIPYDLLPLANDLDATVVPKIAALLRSSGAQVAHTHMIHADLYGTLAARLAGATIVQSRHNDDKFRRRWIVRRLTRWLAAQAETVIAISDSLAAFVRDVEGVPGQKIVRIHYGLDPAPAAGIGPGSLRRELGLSADTPLVGALGRLTEQKGFAYLLEAFARVRSKIANARLVIAGEGELRSALEKKSAALGLSGSVHFLGWRSDAISIMADIHVLAAPSLWEGFGLVTLEAMAASKPIVASRAGALPEIIVDEETGLLVPPADADALAAALTAVLDDAGRAAAMGRRGRARLEREFTVQRMAQQHAAVYRRVANDE